MQDTELLLDVNASNLHGNWSLNSINNEFLLDGSYFYINFDRTGTTRIGKWVLNHSFMMPGIVATGVALLVGLLLIQLY